MRTAIVHEWLVNYAGSERVLEQIIHLYPHADLYSVCDFLPAGERTFLHNKNVKTSFIQNLPLAKKKYRSYLPLMPYAMKRLNLSGYDLIISNSHSVAKGIRKNSKQLLICYCHTPMRYAWDLQSQYLKESGLDRGIKGAVVKTVLKQIRRWDISTSENVDYFISNSHYIRNRIQRAYGRDATVIYPPVDIATFALNTQKENYFLTVSRMVPYKKIDLIIEAFSEMGLRLIVIGHGPDFDKIKSRAKNNITFLGYQKDEMLKEYMKKARAFVFAAEEDFGIVPVEAQACGTPVIAFGRGGVTETVISYDTADHKAGTSATPAPTGIFFDEQTPASLIDAVKRFEAAEDTFDPLEIRRNAERFSIERFRLEFKHFTDEKVKNFFMQC